MIRRSLIALVLIALVAAFWWIGRPKPIAVTVKEIDRGKVESSIANTRAGTVDACQRTKLSTIMGGRIEVLAVKEGDRVQKGQLLMKLWNDDQQAQSTLAMTQVVTARQRVTEACEQATNAVPQIEGKKVKVFGVTSAKRMSLPLLANVPTLAENGLNDFNVSVWHGLYAPRGTPPAVLTKLNQALRAALKDLDLIKRQEALGISVVADDRLAPAGHRKFVEAEMTRWAGVIKAAGQYAD